ncbi:MAG: FAD-binding oxidoreductase, partial [Candidatus Dormibacteraeota bacterium]|nr:FAD-binding oxidoreductase [Candidatus Dormibacteraeota bacterium]
TGAIAVGAGEVGLDLTGLDRIVEVDDVNLTVRVEAGVNGLVLEEALNRRGLTLGHFPSSLPVATIGGLISTRSSGQFSSSYGGIEQMVMGLTVCLPDGRIAQARPGPRSAAGPALHELFLGAEGALGVVLEAVLRVSRLPPASFGLGFDFPSLGAGLEAMRSVMQQGIRPFLLRLYDVEDTAFQDSEAAGCLLIAGVSGETGIATAARAAVTETCLREGGRDLGEAPYTRWTQRRFHLSRERMLASLEAPGSFLDTIEVAAAWDRLEALHRTVKAVLAREGIGLCHFSHAYPQGCCAYFTFAGAAASEEAAQAAYARCWESTMTACLEHSATIAHHHGVGQVRAPWVRREMGEWWAVWQSVRSGLDPTDLMNPNAVGGRWQPPS